MQEEKSEPQIEKKPSGHGLAIILLWVSILIFSAGSSIVAKLGLLGAHHLVEGRNPVSFCNVLFAANIIAGVTLLIIHRKSWTASELRKIKGSEWVHMVIIAILSGVISPSLFFIGLMLTEVINVVLISTLDIPLALFFAWLILKERSNFGTILSASITLLGIILTFYLHQIAYMPMEMKMTMINIGEGPVAHFLARLPKSGELCIAAATIIGVISTVYSRKVLDTVSIGIFSVFRMIIGAIIFFFIVIIMLGWVHFIDIFNPFLLRWMLVYGIGILALGLFFWYKGMQSSTSADLTIANSFSPVAGIAFAYFILGEIPQLGQVIGGAVIILGIAVGLFFKLREERLKKIGKQKPCPFSGV